MGPDASGAAGDESRHALQRPPGSPLAAAAAGVSDGALHWTESLPRWLSASLCRDEWMNG